MAHAKRYILLTLVLTNIFLWYAIFRDADDNTLIIAFLDVGQGDAVFIEGPGGNQVLIDGGSNKKVLEELGKIMPFYDRSIDVVIATHPDKDHIGGLPDVFKSFTVSAVLDPGVSHDTSTYEEYKKLIAEEEIYSMEARRGQIINLGDGAYIRILFPDRDVSGVDPNDASVIAQVVYGETNIMLTGDATKSVEEYMALLDDVTLQSDVLKVGHHGSKTSSAEIFVGFVSPDYAVVSAGEDNRYGHPHEEVLNTLNQFGATIIGTYESGTVVFESDGNALRVR